MKIEVYLEIGESNFADQIAKNLTELLHTEFAPQKMYVNWHHVFLEDSKVGLSPMRQEIFETRHGIWPAVYLILATVLMGSCSERGNEESEPAGISSAPDDVVPAIKTAEVPLPLPAGWRERIDDPSTDGWDTEAMASNALNQLNKLGRLLTGPNRDIAARSIRELVTEDESISRLVPAQLERVFDDGVTTVDRFENPPAWSKPAGGLAGAIDGAMPGEGEAEGAQFEFKIFRVLPRAEDRFVTHQYFSVSWRTGEAVVEQHSTWIVEWQPRGGDLGPLIHRVKVGEFEQARTTLVAGRPLFADCTEAVLGKNDCYRDQLLYGLNHWLERIPYRVPMNFSGVPGIALGDVNGDGLDDLYLCQEPGLPNRLFLQNPDGSLEDVSENWQVNWLEDSRGALLVDFDNDGDRDLAVGVYGSVVLASNEENAGFRIEAVLPVSASTTSMSAADFDRDGLLDLYVCSYAPDHSLTESVRGGIGGMTNRLVYHDSNSGAENALFHNRSVAGRWEFANVTDEAGLDLNNHRWSLASAWEDFDNDGDQDLYVANDFGRNNLYRNDTEGAALKFVDVAALTGTEDSASGMSATWGDYDRDGWMDLYVSNMFSAAGSRITVQPKFKPGLSDTVRRRFSRFARGNSLFKNGGRPDSAIGPVFADVSQSAGVTMGRWAWGSNFADLNNDGWEDLVVANGNVTGLDETGGDL